MKVQRNGVSGPNNEPLMAFDLATQTDKERKRKRKDRLISARIQQLAGNITAAIIFQKGQLLGNRGETSRIRCFEPHSVAHGSLNFPSLQNSCTRTLNT